ncbi:MAG: F0F1 ATP synthase subunit A [bacterium]
MTNPSNNIFELLTHHMSDSVLIRVNLFGADLSITKYVFFMWIISLGLFWFLYSIARKYKKYGISAPDRSMVLLEVFIEFVRDDIVRPFIGPDRERAYLHFFCTQFLFILACNLVGLIPKSVTVTSNLAVTMGLALVTFFFTQIYGMVMHGPISYWKHLVPEGVPVFLAPIIGLNEFISMFSKPFALMIRLFANMLAGHIIIFVILYLVIMFRNIFLGVFTVPTAVAVSLLEIFVCLLQAYIFTFLSAIFVGMAGEAH